MLALASVVSIMRSFRRRARLHTLLWSFVLLCLFSATVSAQSGREKFPFTGRITADRVNLRAGQSNNYEALAIVNKGDELVVIGKNYSWYKVRLPQDAKMYVKMDYARLLSTDIGEVTGDKVNIRARPNTGSTIIGKLLKGEQFFIRENAGDWLLIRPVVKAQGWVHQDFIEFRKAETSLKLYPDPADAVARARVQKEALDRARAAKFAMLRPVAEGQYEAGGILARSLEGAVFVYKLMDSAKGNMCVAYVEGPAAMLDDFVGEKVLVRGNPKDDPAHSAAVLSLSKISLALR